MTSPTSLLQQDLTGWAKPGSTVSVEGAAASASAGADPYNGRFRVTVMLAPMTTNMLHVFASNGDGKSRPTNVSIVTPAPADRVTLQLSSNTMKAGGSVTAKVTVFDTNGMPTSMTLAPTVSAGPTGAGAVTVSGTGTTADPFKLTGTLAGVYTITAALSPDKSASATLAVTPADPTLAPDLHIRLASDPHGTDVTNLSAGTAIVYRYSVVDQYGNDLVSPDVTVSTTMPGATVGPVDTQETDAAGHTVYQGAILSFVRSGAWPISAHLVSTTLTQSKTVMVGTDVAGLVAHLTVSSNSTQVNNPLSYKVVVLDEFGNADTASLSRLSLAVTPATTTPATCSPNACATAAASGTVSFPQSGSYQLAASFSGTPAVVGDSVFVAVINAPVPPTLTIFSPTAADSFAPGATVSIRVQTHTASAGGGTAAFIASFPGASRSGTTPIGQDVCASGASGCSPLFTFTIPGGVGFTTATVTVYITDGSTGASITKSVTFNVNPFLNVVANGRTVTLVAFGGNLNTPMGLTLEESAGKNLYVANNGSRNALKLDLTQSLPINPSTANLFSSGLANAPTDVKLRPAAGALGTYPPAAFQGLYIGTDGGGPVRVTDTIGVSSPFGTNTTLTSLIYDKANTRLFAPENGAGPVHVLDPATGADLAATPLNLGLGAPWGVAIISSPGNTRLVAGNDGGGNRLRMCDLGTATTSPAINVACTGSLATLADPAAGALVRNPRAIAIGPASGLIYVASSGNGRVLAYNPASCAGGTCAESLIASGFDTPNGLAFDAAGNLYVGDEALNMIVRIAPSGVPF